MPAGGPIASAVYAITDAIPFYEIGTVVQRFDNVCSDTSGCKLDYDDEGLGSISPEEELRMLQELSLDELRTFSREMELSDEGDKKQLIAGLQAAMAEERLADAEEGEEELGMEPLPAQGGERGGGQSDGETRPSLYTRVVYDDGAP